MTDGMDNSIETCSVTGPELGDGKRLRVGDDDSGDGFPEQVEVDVESAEQISERSKGMKKTFFMVLKMRKSAESISLLKKGNE